MLAQAPGPDSARDALQDVKTIAADDLSIVAMPSAPSWDSTWSSVLTALSSNGTTESNSTGNGSQDTTNTDHASTNKLSTGAIVGIVVAGVLAGVVMIGTAVFFFIRRRKRTIAPVQAPNLAESKEWDSMTPLSRYRICSTSSRSSPRGSRRLPNIRS